MPEETQFRAFQSSDAAAVIALWGQVLPAGAKAWNEPLGSLVKKVRHGDGLVFVAYLEGQLVGAVKAGYDGVRGWIYRLAVHPDYRRQGVGRGLVFHAEQELTARGCPKVNLQVRESNQGVIEFYLKCGFNIDQCIGLGKHLIASSDSQLPPQHTIPVNEEIVLSPPNSSDRESLVEHLNATDEFMACTQGIPFPYLKFDAERWLAFATEHHDDHVSLVIRDSINQQAIGNIAVMNMIAGQQGEVGYWLAKSHWGRGIMSEALKAFCEFAFSEFDLVRLNAKVYSSNPASARVLTKAGFVHEGTLRKACFHNGHVVDDLLFGLLRQEFSWTSESSQS